MHVTELDTFVDKFKQLWISGLDAHLDVESHAGQAWVGLRLHLGYVPGPLLHPPHNPRRARDSPARQRRRARRAAARQEHVEETSSEETEKVDNVRNEIGSDETIIEDEKETEAVENTAATVDVTEAVHPRVEPCEVATDIDGDDKNEISEIDDTTDKKDATEENETNAQAKVMKEVTDEVCPDNIYAEEVEVLVTAVFEDSREEILTQDDFNSLEKILLGARHLTENILKISAGQQTNRKFRTGLFKHTLELRILVKTGKLWESPRSYIWKNLEQDMRTKRNGTKLKLVKIHVRN